MSPSKALPYLMGRRLLIGSGGPTISAPGLGANREARERARASLLPEAEFGKLEEELELLEDVCEFWQIGEVEQKQRQGLLESGADEEEGGSSTWSRVCRPICRCSPSITVFFVYQEALLPPPWIILVLDDSSNSRCLLCCSTVDLEEKRAQMKLTAELEADFFLFVSRFFLFSCLSIRQHWNRPSCHRGAF